MLEVGKKYKTRNGRWAKVIVIVPEAPDDRQLVAQHENNNLTLHFMSGSYYNDDVPSSFDLFPEEYAEPKSKVEMCQMKGLETAMREQVKRRKEATRNDWLYIFAGQVLQGMVSRGGGDTEERARIAVQYAKALLAELEKE